MYQQRTQLSVGSSYRQGANQGKSISPGRPVDATAAEQTRLLNGDAAAPHVARAPQMLPVNPDRDTAGSEGRREGGENADWESDRE